MIFDKEPQLAEMRGCVNRLIGFAERQEILDIEMLARLGSEDSDQFRSAIHELAVAEFLSPVGDIEWHTPGRESRVGEFEIKPTNHEPIFVEVKTIFEGEDIKRQTRNWEQIKQITHDIASSFVVDLEFLELPCDMAGRRFRPWFTQQVRTLALEIKTVGQSRELIFKDVINAETIIRVKVTFTKMWDDEKPTLCSMSWGKENKELHERVKSVIDAALGQLPDTEPTLVVVAPAILGIDEFQMLAAMFSFPKVTIGTAPSKQEPTVHYDLQGIVQQSIRKRLSAVGVWHQKWTKEPQGSLDIYHNPLRAREISYQIFELPSVYQLIPKVEGIMEWIPNRPSQ